MTQSHSQVRELLHEAVVLTEARLRERSAEAVERNLQDLLDALGRAQSARENSIPANIEELRGLLWWVADWIPDPDDEILQVLADLRAALGAGREK